ncbi:hypothetical protein GS597_13025 [Synechococcales cyanobacterium C]|uniref:Uncharacterized protein n=1 Tax=Petrachloros mirabilis ULC683 TaxID=2781853 RepID=A0A8K2A7Y4_9CYAN|nr:hypothetical protein [Petrachloros mirabilis]NCJ07414.1 hypothetical protein [Petrachloros mirabilis ULC683]
MSVNNYLEEAKAITSKADELVASAKYQAGAEACIKLVREYVESEVLVFWESGELSESDLVSTELLKQSDKSKGIQRRIDQLSEQIKFVIKKVAQEIEDNCFENWEDAIEGFQDASPMQRKKVTQLVYAEKEINISLQSLKTTIELFSHLNKYIINELEQSESTSDKSQQKKLILTNAILIYELASFAIDYLAQFDIQGMNGINEVEKEINVREKSLKFDLQELENLINKNSNDFPNSTKTRIKEDINNKHKILDLMLKEWQDYKSQIDSKHSQAIETCKKSRSILEAKRLEAKTNLGVYACAWWIGRAKGTLDDIEGIAAIVNELELASLTTDRVQRLFLNPGDSTLRTL